MNDITTILRKRGIKVTPQRRTVYCKLKEIGHSSVDEIIEAIRKTNPDVNIATVYNILECFTEHGVIAQIGTKMGKLYYDITPEEHAHIITDDCSIIDYREEELTALIKEYLERHPIDGCDIKKIDLQIYTTKKQ